jgi:hypothetical protein
VYVAKQRLGKIVTAAIKYTRKNGRIIGRAFFCIQDITLLVLPRTYCQFIIKKGKHTEGKKEGCSEVYRINRKENKQILGY